MNLHSRIGVRIQILLYDGFDELDAFGPFEVLSQARARGAQLQVELVVHGREDTVTGANGARLHAGRRLEIGDPPDLLIVPGGGWASHATRLATVAADGRLWESRCTAVPSPGEVDSYLAEAGDGQSSGHMLPWAVRELRSGAVVGSTRYHDVVPEIDRVEIGHTWYAASRQRSHVNTACKLLLLTHAFETLGCAVVGLRTDRFNLASQRAIEALGARKDGVIRHHRRRKDGTVRDTVMYSILAGEWPDVERHLTFRLARHGGAPGDPPPRPQG